MANAKTAALLPAAAENKIDPKLLNRLVNQLMVCHGAARGKKQSEEDFLAVEAENRRVLLSTEPHNELEAMLAAQMVAVHNASMRDLAYGEILVSKLPGLAIRGKSPSNTNTEMAVKLMRTFVAQIEALSRLRGGGQQNIRVEHVTVQPGGQAIVGNVTSPKGGRKRRGYR